MDISKLRKKAKEQQAKDRDPGSMVRGAGAGEAEQKGEAGSRKPEHEIKITDHGQLNTEGVNRKTEVPKPEPAEKPLLELAREELKKYPADEKEKELLCFTLANQEYAIELSIVREIIRIKEITPVPNISEFVLGIIVLRGEIIPVIDLRKRIGLPFLGFTPNTRFVMVSFADSLTGLVVDSIPDVKKVSVESIQSAELVGSVDVRFLAGISTSKGGFTILLKLEEILKQSDMFKA